MKTLAILGATGRTGRHVVTQALAAGHTVRALARIPSQLPARERLTVLGGDARMGEDVAALVAGADAVVSALGPVPGIPDVCSQATRHVLSALARRPGVRYVTVSGAGLDVPGDDKDLPGRVISWLIRTVSPAIVADKALEYRLLAEGTTPFVLVRPPRLTDKPATGRWQQRLERSPGTAITRADLATACLHFALAADVPLRRAPFVSG
ncbi:MAG: NAD(P)H-binding protein [Gemmatimonadaceae bacterium]|jgi:nucleoside-diphosphate-sugar epimerase|nr:NAD(P)H-binding protein [Gemmatimonadaceae bacterium]